jgi:hypothetical protein
LCAPACVAVWARALEASSIALHAMDARTAMILS